MTTTADDVMVRELAEHAGVCVRPLVRKLIDLASGEERHVPIPCGSTRERVCPSCAARARKLRMQQCREGWHRDTEPEAADHDEDGGIVVPDLTGLDETSARESADLELVVTGKRFDTDVEPGTVLDQSPKPGERVTSTSEISVVLASADEGDRDEALDQAGGTRRRTTRRRQDAATLPKKPMTDTTLGRTFRAPGGKAYRPSMFLTFTLPSYGPVRSDGTPRDPETYDYRRAALDALHFPKLVDRLIQNLRRCAGYNAQYFATVEPQKRLALHLHAAVRGTIPRDTVRQVVDATYHQLWWPEHDDPIYVDELPAWSDQHGAYVDPYSGAPLPTWGQALDDLDHPAHVVRPGKQLDYQGIVQDAESKVDKAIGYLTKYLTKSVAETYDPETITKRQGAHRDRLHAEIRWLPCSPQCANWLRYGVQPKDAEAGMKPGECGKPAHELENLGHGGRRVLVSRDWSGKTLKAHRADRSTVVRQVLAEAGVDMHDTDRCAADAVDDQGRPRFVWEPVDVARGDQPPSYRELIKASVRERNRWRVQYQAACELLAARDGPPATRSAKQIPQQATV